MRFWDWKPRPIFWWQQDAGGKVPPFFYFSKVLMLRGSNPGDSAAKILGIQSWKMVTKSPHYQASPSFFCRWTVFCSGNTSTIPTQWTSLRWSHVTRPTLPMTTWCQPICNSPATLLVFRFYRMAKRWAFARMTTSSSCRHAEVTAADASFTSPVVWVTARPRCRRKPWDGTCLWLWESPKIGRSMAQCQGSTRVCSIGFLAKSFGEESFNSNLKLIALAKKHTIVHWTDWNWLKTACLLCYDWNVFFFPDGWKRIAIV